MSLRILLVPMDQGACAFYRVIEPARIARGIGVDAQILSQIKVWGAPTEDGSEIIEEVLHEADVMVIQRPLAQNVYAVAAQAKRQGIRIVVEMDDDLHAVHKRNTVQRFIDPKNQPLHNWEWAARTIELADLLTVSTPALCRYGPEKAVVVRNRLPEAILPLRPDSSPARGVVGWTGTVSVHPEDLQSTDGGLSKVDAPFRVVGVLDGVADALRLPPSRVALGAAWDNDIPTYWARVAATIGIGIAPLQRSAFNDAKCLDAETRIATNVGVLRAADIQPGMRVLRDGVWRRVQAAQSELPRPGLQLNMEHGYQLRLTPEHRMLVNGVWTHAADLASGDLLAMEPEAIATTDQQSVNWPGDSRMSRSGSGRGAATFDPYAFMEATDGPKVAITPRWGRFLGAFAGDGSVSNTGVCISCDGQDPDWIALMVDDLAQMSLNPATEQQVRTFDGALIRRRHVRTSSAHLLRVLEALGVVQRRPSGAYIRHVCVPEVIWRSPRDVVAEFVAGYFEADGTTHGAGVSVTSKSEQMVRDVQRLLLLFGITAKLDKRDGRAQNGFKGSYWHLTLRRAEADVFAKEIGFRSQRKIARLAATIAKPHSNRYEPLRWNRAVLSVERCMVTPVDLQVEGEAFAAAGFISHNSALKCQEYMALGIPYVASPAPEYRWLTAESAAGVIATARGQWGRAVNRLLRDDDEYQQRRQAGLEWSRQHTMERHIGEWTAAWARAADPVTKGLTVIV